MSAGVAPNPAGQSIVYIFGGTDLEGGTGFRVQAYNAATNAWTFKASRVSVFESNGVGRIGGRLYFSGGYNQVEIPSFTNRVWAYRFSDDQMIRRADLPILAAEGVTGVIDGKLYVLPGACSGDLYPNPGYCAEERTRRFFRFTPETNTWVSRRRAPHYHRKGAAAVLNGKLYVVAGFDNFVPVTDLDVYDPATNTWTTLAPIPTGGAAIGAPLGGRFHVMTFDESGVIRTYAYNPATNSWRQRASPNFRHDAVVQILLGGGTRLLAVGGTHGPNQDVPNDSELYTP
jgi:N-acetylneuraminic acid mutarotase